MLATCLTRIYLFAFRINAETCFWFGLVAVCLKIPSIFRSLLFAFEWRMVYCCFYGLSVGIHLKYWFWLFIGPAIEFQFELHWLYQNACAWKSMIFNFKGICRHLQLIHPFVALILRSMGHELGSNLMQKYSLFYKDGNELEEPINIWCS